MSVTIFTDEGEVREYRTLSERLPEFLEAYPPKEGYRVIIEVEDVLAIKPGLHRLYESAVQAGRKPEEMGLPPVPDGTAMVFKASLLGPDGQVLLTASAVKPILEYKDYEKGETAARQRLIAAAGFAGDVLDRDEAEDMADQDLRIAGGAEDGAQPEPIPPAQEPDPAPVQAEEKEAEAKPKRNTRRKRAAVEKQEATAAPPNGQVPPALLRHIEMLATKAGIEVDLSLITTREQATAKIRELS